MKAEMKRLNEKFADLKQEVNAIASRMQPTTNFDAINDAESKTPVETV